MTPIFGIIAEGKTDQIVIGNILAGFFNNYDLIVRELQPALFATEPSQISKFGGWYNVFQYCQSDFFLPAFEDNDFIIIQIDSDCSNEKHFEVPKTDGEKVEFFVERIRKRFQSVISESNGREEYDRIAERIIFAIAVNSIECWLLPLVYNDKTQGATDNCLFKLNKKLPDGSKINPSKKDKRIYQKISKDFIKTKTLQKAFPQNPSLKIFVESLENKFELSQK